MNGEGSSCGRCRSPLEAGDLRCATCALVVPEGSAPAAREGPRALVYRCTSCDAAARYDPAARGVRCAFCGEVMEREEVLDPVEQTEQWLPFQVGVDEARQALRAWLGGLGWFRPADLKSEARIESLRPLWWVAWVFDAQASITWAADSDAGAGSSAWAPHSGRAELTFDDIPVSASRGLSSEETAALAGSYQLTSARPEPAGVALDGATLEAFDVQRSQARALVLDAVDEAAAREVELKLCPGTKHRKVHVATLLSRLDTRRLALPAWVLAYRYRKRLFRVVISGQQAYCLHGRAPYSVARILLVVAGAALALVALLGVVLANI